MAEDGPEGQLWCLDAEKTRGYTVANLHLMLLDLVYLVWAETGERVTLEFLARESARGPHPNRSGKWIPTARASQSSRFI